MTTDKQREANRRNAQKSTGPTTDEGKQVSKMNATKHGLTAETVVIKDEDPEAFQYLRGELIEEFAPKTALEGLLVDRLAGIFWRLRRIPEIEASLIEAHRLEVDHDNAKAEYEWHKEDLANAVKQIEEITGLEDDDLGDFRISANEKHERINDTRKGLNAPAARLGRAFLKSIQSSDTIGKLSRYERDLVRMLNTTLEQLKRAKSDASASDEQHTIVELKALPEDQ